MEVTEEDQKAIAEAASQFMKANSKETIETLSVTEDQIKTYLELRTYQMRMHECHHSRGEIPRHSRMKRLSSPLSALVSISTADLEEEDVEAKKKDAQKILDEMKKIRRADFDETVKKSVSEDYNAGRHLWRQTKEERGQRGRRRRSDILGYRKRLFPC